LGAGCKLHLAFGNTPCDDVATEIRHTGDPPRKGGFLIAPIIEVVSFSRQSAEMCRLHP
jgi:hypothetical protein